MARTKQTNRSRAWKRTRDDDAVGPYVPMKLWTMYIDVDYREECEIFIDNLKHLRKDQIETFLFNALPNWDPVSRMSFSDRCYADVSYSFEDGRRMACDLPALTIQLILTFAFLHLSPYQRGRFTERHRAAAVYEVLPASPEPSSTSESESESEDDDLSATNVSSGAEEESHQSEREVISVQDSDQEELGPEDEEVEAAYDSGADLSYAEAVQDTDFDEVITLPGSSTRVVRKKVVNKNPTGPDAKVGPWNRPAVGYYRRGDQWNGAPPPLADRSLPHLYNDQPFRYSNAHCGSISASLGESRRWDSRFPPPTFDNYRELPDHLKEEIICAEIPYKWTSPNGRAYLTEWEEDNARRLEWCIEAQTIRDHKLSFWRGYYIRRAQNLLWIRQPCHRNLDSTQY